MGPPSSCPPPDRHQDQVRGPFSLSLSLRFLLVCPYAQFALHTGGQTETITRRNMSMIVGTGDYRYEVNADWAKLPDGWSFKEVGGLGVDSNDNVYVFNRGDHPMMVFDREGNFLRSWGEGQYPRAHGVNRAR